jgi:hypothetical protein
MGVWTIQRAARCHRCQLEPVLDQLRLFDVDRVDTGSQVGRDCAVLIETAPDGWPSIVTSRRGHHGFWRELTPAVFGHREGIGPLVVMPDTSVLIEFREYMDRVGDGALIAIAPNWSPLRDRLDAMFLRSAGVQAVSRGSASSWSHPVSFPRPIGSRTRMRIAGPIALHHERGLRWRYGDDRGGSD